MTGLMDTLLAYILVGTFIVVAVGKYFSTVIQLFLELLRGFGLLK
jgi:hypothetical protein